MTVFRTLAMLKVYFAGASLYLGVLNFLLLLATFKLSYGIAVSAYLVVPLGFALALLIGYLDYVLIRKHENVHSNKMNDLKDQLDRIEKACGGRR